MTEEQAKQLVQNVNRMEKQLDDIENYLKSVEKAAYEARTLIEGLELDFAQRFLRGQYYSDFPLDREYLETLEGDVKRLQEIKTLIETRIA